MHNTAMNWEDARLFLAVARSGQMLGAARRLGVNQATLSRRVLVLEKELQVTLLHRRPHGCDLTDEGRRLAERLERVESEFLRAESEIRGRDMAVTGTVRIGAPDGFGTAFLAPRLKLLAQRHPGLAVQLVPVPRSFSLSRREADIAVIVGQPERGQLVTRRLMDYSLSLYATPEYLRQAPPLNSAADLSAHDLVGYVEDLIYAPGLDYAQEITRTWTNRIEVSSALGQQEVVRAGGGIGLLHDYLVTPEMGLVRVLPDMSIQRAYWIVFHESLRDMRRIQITTDFLLEIVRDAGRT
ncbi:LysR family transcriptional regulator [Pseudoruegeria sp. SK021]|uniref:LysR family transcriptional regulator n=1 Tax=Pseudoruegeria sp. SK021 TaxID=1933035 RepID=UPI001F0A12A8|nr:LysR family transcriptional regulator [Pseudoruegeria sp. SK021]